MKIKNTRELVLRAQWHARHDHVKQGTYGDVSMNGEVEYQGCAIGCLSTPHTKKGMRAYFDKFSSRWYRSGGGRTVVLPESDVMVRDLGKEFGICPALARAAEECFEGAETHGAAISFIPAFAKALNEGARISDRQVERWTERHWDEHIIGAEGTRKFLEWLSGLGPKS
jgi:hypothetical protein